MKLTAAPSNNLPQVHPIATSVCLWSSPKWSDDKHWKPFEEFMRSKPAMDVLVYHEPGHHLAEAAGELGARTFAVTSGEKGFHRHFWRYIGGEQTEYPRIWFRGMDGVFTPSREERLLAATESIESEALIWQRPGILCMGKLGSANRGGEKLLKWLRENPWAAGPDVWDVDERTLHNWVDKGSARITLAVDDPNPWQIGWMVDRMLCGNHTAIIKDRDDRG